MPSTQNKLSLSIIMGAAALLIYGGLTYYINYEHGFRLAMQAAVAQGALCFVATLSSSWLMQFFFGFGKNNWQRFFFAWGGAGSIMIGLMVTGHILNQTPELCNTVITAALLGSPYYTLFPLFLIRRRNLELDPSRAEIKLWSFPYSTPDFLRVVKNNILGVSSKNRACSNNCANPITLNEIEPKIKIGFLGDLMPLHDKPFSLDPQLIEFFNGIDYLVANFEGSLFPSQKKGLLAQLHQHDILELIRPIMAPERTILSCANNHAADFGYDNFLQNNAHLEELGYTVIGSKTRPNTIIEDKIAITAVTEWSNQKADYMASLDDAFKVKANDKLQILYPHWCLELELYPTKKQIRRAKDLLQNFDLIIGHHSHSPGVITTHEISGVEKMTAYSLGDTTIAINGPGFKHYVWGQAMVAEFGIKKGARIDEQWQQGKTEWVYTKVVKDVDFGETKAMKVEMHRNCPWV
jgi:hypothetical protein